MTKRICGVILAFVLVFMTGFICLGYAVIVDTLTINGSATLSIPEGLFITQIKTLSTSNTRYQFKLQRIVI